MKKQIVIPALFVLGMATAPLMASNSFIAQADVTVYIDQEKVKIEPEDLPQAIKESIAASEEVAGLNISEAWQILAEDGSAYFKVKFDNAGEELVKKYDAQGNEIND